MSNEGTKPYPVVYDAPSGAIQYSFQDGYYTVPEASVNAITSLTGAVLATGPGAAASSFALPMILNGSASPAFLEWTGKAADGSTDVGGMAAYLGHNGPNNRQLVLVDIAHAGSSAGSGVAFLSSSGFPQLFGALGDLSASTKLILGVASQNTEVSGPLGVGVDAVASAMLQADSTTRGFLPPRMTMTQRNAISSPAEGLEVYNITTHETEVWNGTSWVGGGATPAGANTQVQYNNSGAFGADADLTWDNTTQTFTIGSLTTIGASAFLQLKDNSSTLDGGVNIKLFSDNDVEIDFFNHDGSTQYGVVTGDTTQMSIQSKTDVTLISNDAVTPNTLRLGADGGLQLPPLTARPGSPVEGEVIYNSTTHHVEYWNGSAWVTL